MKSKPTAYRMPGWLALISRTFPGTRKTIAGWKGVQTATTGEYGNIEFPYDRKMMDGKRFIAIVSGCFEKEEIEIATSVVRDDDVLVEFGAGMGITAAMVNKRCSPKRHICFEANPLLKDYATRLFRENKLGIELLNCGLGDGSNLKFYINRDYVYSSFEASKRDNCTEQKTIPTIKLRDVIKSHDPTVVFCDIEGAELKYLKSPSFGNVRDIVIELHPGAYGREGVESVKGYLESQGFRLSRKLRNVYLFSIS